MMNGYIYRSKSLFVGSFKAEGISQIIEFLFIFLHFYLAEPHVVLFLLDHVFQLRQNYFLQGDLLVIGFFNYFNFSSTLVQVEFGLFFKFLKLGETLVYFI